MSIFEEVKAQLNIQTVVEHYGFKVNRARQFTCPFHNDHKPSASIKNDYFNCFVCGAAGDAITFTAKYLGLSNLEAAKELVRVFGLNIDISTAEERKAQYIAEHKRKAEVKACSNLRDKFAKDKEIRGQARKPTLYRLRNEVRQTHKKNEQEQEAYIHHVGLLLADIHRFMWQGIHLYPITDKRHIWALQELTTCEYFIECYENDAKEFCRECKGVIDRYERELDSINQQGR